MPTLSITKLVSDTNLGKKTNCYMIYQLHEYPNRGMANRTLSTYIIQTGLQYNLQNNSHSTHCQTKQSNISQFLCIIYSFIQYSMCVGVFVWGSISIATYFSLSLSWTFQIQTKNCRKMRLLDANYAHTIVSLKPQTQRKKCNASKKKTPHLLINVRNMYEYTEQKTNFAWIRKCLSSVVFLYFYFPFDCVVGIEL